MTYKQMLDAIDLLTRQIKILENRVVLLEKQNTFYSSTQKETQ